MKFSLTHQRPKLLSYKNQSIYLCDKFTDWFLYDGNFGLEWSRDFLKKHKQVHSFLRIYSGLVRKSLTHFMPLISFDTP